MCTTTRATIDITGLAIAVIGITMGIQESLIASTENTIGNITDAKPANMNDGTIETILDGMVTIVRIIVIFMIGNATVTKTSIVAIDTTGKYGKLRVAI